MLGDGIVVMDVRSYLDYKDSLEDYAVAFVKQYLPAARDNWIDILYAHAPAHEGYEYTKLWFRRVICALFPKRLPQVALLRRDFESEEDYRLACKAVTWETARKDIELQREQGALGDEYTIDGMRQRVDNPGYKVNDNVVGPLRADLTQLIHGAGAKTDPLWDVALNCMSYDDGYMFLIKDIKHGC